MLRAIPTEIAVAEVPAGGVVVFSSLTPHLTGPNMTDAVRKAYILQYAPTGAIVCAATGGEPTAREPATHPTASSRSSSTASRSDKARHPDGSQLRGSTLTSFLGRRRRWWPCRSSPSICSAPDKPFEVLPHPPAMNSIDEARVIGIGAEEVIKTVVLDTDTVGTARGAPGDPTRLDLKLTQPRSRTARAHLASEDEMSRDFPDFELGAVPPLGSLLGIPTYVDPEVMAHETVVFAGSQRESVKIRTAALFDDESVTVVPLTLHPDYDDF